MLNATLRDGLDHDTWQDDTQHVATVGAPFLMQWQLSLTEVSSCWVLWRHFFFMPSKNSHPVGKMKLWKKSLIICLSIDDKCSFTLATFVSNNVSNSDTWLYLPWPPCCIAKGIPVTGVIALNFANGNLMNSTNNFAIFCAIGFLMKLTHLSPVQYWFVKYKSTQI